MPTRDYATAHKSSFENDFNPSISAYQYRNQSKQSIATMKISNSDIMLQL